MSILPPYYEHEQNLKIDYVVGGVRADDDDVIEVSGDIGEVLENIIEFDEPSRRRAASEPPQDARGRARCRERDHFIIMNR